MQLERARHILVVLSAKLEERTLPLHLTTAPTHAVKISVRTYHIADRHPQQLRYIRTRFGGHG
jgi:hypothetical protein